METAAAAAPELSPNGGGRRRSLMRSSRLSSSNERINSSTGGSNNISENTPTRSFSAACSTCSPATAAGDAASDFAVGCAASAGAAASATAGFSYPFPRGTRATRGRRRSSSKRCCSTTPASSETGGAAAASAAAVIGAGEVLAGSTFAGRVLRFPAPLSVHVALSLSDLLLASTNVLLLLLVQQTFPARLSLPSLFDQRGMEVAAAGESGREAARAAAAAGAAAGAAEVGTMADVGLQRQQYSAPEQRHGNTGGFVPSGSGEEAAAAPQLQQLLTPEQLHVPFFEVLHAGAAAGDTGGLEVITVAVWNLLLLLLFKVVVLVSCSCHCRSLEAPGKQQQQQEQRMPQQPSRKDSQQQQDEIKSSSNMSLWRKGRASAARTGKPAVEVCRGEAAGAGVHAASVSAVCGRLLRACWLQPQLLGVSFPRSLLQLKIGHRREGVHVSGVVGLLVLAAADGRSTYYCSLSLILCLYLLWVALLALLMLLLGAPLLHLPACIALAAHLASLGLLSPVAAALAEECRRAAVVAAATAQQQQQQRRRKSHQQQQRKQLLPHEDVDDEASHWQSIPRPRFAATPRSGAGTAASDTSDSSLLRSAARLLRHEWGAALQRLQQRGREFRRRVHAGLATAVAAVVAGALEEDGPLSALQQQQLVMVAAFLPFVTSGCCCVLLCYLLSMNWLNLYIYFPFPLLLGVVAGQLVGAAAAVLLLLAAAAYVWMDNSTSDSSRDVDAAAAELAPPLLQQLLLLSTSCMQQQKGEQHDAGRCTSSTNSNCDQPAEERYATVWTQEEEAATTEEEDGKENEEDIAAAARADGGVVATTVTAEVIEDSGTLEGSRRRRRLKLLKVI